MVPDKHFKLSLQGWHCILCACDIDADEGIERPFYNHGENWWDKVNISGEIGQGQGVLISGSA